MFMVSELIGVISIAAVIVHRFVPHDALGFRLGDDVVRRLNVIPPCPLQTLRQAMATAMPPTVVGVAAAARGIHARKWLGNVLRGRRWRFSGQRQRQPKRHREVKR